MSSTLRHLTFEIRVHSANTDDQLVHPEQPGQPYRFAEARPLANGIPLHAGFAFDVTPLIGFGLRSGFSDLYTCDCGIASCARIEEEVELRVEGDTMSWTFPDDPFRAGLAPALFPAGVPLTMHFAGEQYLAALEDVERQLIALAADGGAPVVIAPTVFPSLDVPVTQQLQDSRDWADKRFADLSRRQALFGDFFDKDVLIRFPDGRQRTIMVAVLAEQLAYRQAPQNEQERDAILVHQILPAWRADAAKLFSDLRSQPWDEAYPYMCRVEPDEGEPCPSGWPTVTLSLIAST